MRGVAELCNSCHRSKRVLRRSGGSKLTAKSTIVGLLAALSNL